MPVTIHATIVSDERLTLRVEISKKADQDMLNDRFRDLIAAHLSIHSMYALAGWPSLKYPLKTAFDLTYDARGLEVCVSKADKKPVAVMQRA